MNQDERYHVLRLLDKVSEKEALTLALLNEIKECEVAYDFFEDLYEILYEYAYDEHLVYVRITALFTQFEEEMNNKFDDHNKNI